MGSRIQVTDDFLVKHYLEHILPFVSLNDNQRKLTETSLTNFIKPGQTFRGEIESAIDFYQNLESLKRSLRLIGASEEKIEKLIKVLKNLQDFLFQIPRYRDHLPHQLRVYLLGCLILDLQMQFIAGKVSKKYGLMISEFWRKKDPDKQQRILQSLYHGLISNPQILFDAWSIAGLCHDLGYSVEGVSRIARNLNETYKELVPELNMQMTPKILPNPVLQAQMDSFRNLLLTLFASGGELGKLVDILAKPEKVDHGIWSCFFLTSENLSAEIELKARKLKEKMPDLTIWDLLSDFYLFSGGFFADNLLPVLNSEALVAVAFHNRAHLFRLSPLMCLLVVSDTLQEWDRVGRTETEVDCQKREVFLSFEYKGDELNIESEIDTYDCKPSELYGKMLEDFQPNAAECSAFDLDKVKLDFIKNVKLTMKFGPMAVLLSFSA